MGTGSVVDSADAPLVYSIQIMSSMYFKIDVHICMKHCTGAEYVSTLRLQLLYSMKYVYPRRYRLLEPLLKSSGDEKPKGVEGEGIISMRGEMGVKGATGNEEGEIVCIWGTDVVPFNVDGGGAASDAVITKVSASAASVASPDVGWRQANIIK